MEQQDYLHSKDFSDAGLIAEASGPLAWLPRAELEASHIHTLHLSSKAKLEMLRGQKKWSKILHLYGWIVFSSAGELEIEVNEHLYFPSFPEYYHITS